MAECESLEGMANIYKRRYCLGDNTECARHLVFLKLGKDAVPSDLYPNMRDRARKILEERTGAG
jgi:hypothetical protein